MKRRTTLLLVRYRFHIVRRSSEGEQQLLAEDAQLLSFEGSPENPQWLTNGTPLDLITAKAEANVTLDQARTFTEKVISAIEHLRPQIEVVAKERGQAILDAHTRVRRAGRHASARYHVEPKLPADVLGVFVYLPKGS